MSDAVPLTTTAGLEHAGARSGLKPLVLLVLRYAFSTLGPLSIAGAHFIAALIFLRFLPRAEFGLFSFAFIVVPFTMSMTGALFGASLVNSANRTQSMSEVERAAYMKANLVFAGAAAIAIFGLMLQGTASVGMAAAIAVYGALMNIRWFSRCYFYAIHQMPRAIVSDIVYSGILLGGLGVAVVTHHLDSVVAAMLLAAAAFFALAGFGLDFVAAQFRSLTKGSLRAFLPIWRDLARWSTLGVALSELTSNAHAYLVTFISGPKAFALLAVGSLFMRPASLVLTALPDAERPRMARSVAAGRFDQAMRAVFQFRLAIFAVLAGTAILAAVVMIWFPQLILKRGYDETSVIAVICIWVVVMAIRGLRTPESVLLQVAGEYKTLAGASVRSSVVSILVTFALLLAFGPVVSLAGILIGDLSMTLMIMAQSRALRARHV